MDEELRSEMYLLRGMIFVFGGIALANFQVLYIGLDSVGIVGKAVLLLVLIAGAVFSIWGAIRCRIKRSKDERKERITKVVNKIIDKNISALERMGKE